MKSAQSGGSERIVAESVWVCDQLGKNCLYTFPSQGQLNDFSTGRLDPVINASPYLKSRASGTMNEKDIRSTDKPERVGLKQIGNGFLYLRGSQNETQIISVDADLVVVDERDRFNPSSIPYIDKRLLHSDLKWRRYISTPTIPGKFIHKDFLDSDQMEWFITCDNCGKEQLLDFWKNIRLDKDKKAICVCSGCNKPIERTKDGRWIPQNPGSKIRGYHISGLYNPMLDLDEAWKQSKSSDIFSITQFYNQTLGLPYSSEGARLTDIILDACLRDYPYPGEYKGCFAGADVGNSIHVVVTKNEGEGDDVKTKYIWIGTVNNFEGPQDSLEWLMEKFDIETLVIDMMPETRKVQELCNKYPGRVFGCRYPTQRFAGGYLDWRDDTAEVHADRTMSLDYLVNDFEQQKILLPKQANNLEMFYNHLKTSVRILEESARTGTVVAKWIEDGADHFFHACNYERIARQRLNGGQGFLDYYKGLMDNTKQDLGSLKKLVEDTGTLLH